MLRFKLSNLDPMCMHYVFEIFHLWCSLGLETIFFACIRGLQFMASIIQFSLNCVTDVVVAVAVASVVIESIELFSTNEGQSKYSVAKCDHFRTFHDIEIKMRRLSMFHLCVCVRAAAREREENNSRKKQIANGINKKTFVFQCAEFCYGLASTLNMYVAYVRFTQFARTFRYRSRGCTLFPFLYIRTRCILQ